MHLVRAVLALLLAAPFFLLSSAAPVLGEQAYTAVVTLAAPSAGQVQLFYDDGTGFSEPHSSKAAIQPGLRAYRLPLPIGTIHGLRLDPGQSGGRYLVESFVIRDPAGDAFASVSLAQFTGFHQL
jgi:hypothetical protein